jgi:hypothetical protein
MAGSEVIHFRRSVQLDQIVASLAGVRVNFPSTLQRHLSLNIDLYASSNCFLTNSGSAGERQ